MGNREWVIEKGIGNKAILKTVVFILKLCIAMQAVRGTLVSSPGTRRGYFSPGCGLTVAV